jgi:hypothetical protein
MGGRARESMNSHRGAVRPFLIGKTKHKGQEMMGGTSKKSLDTKSVENDDVSGRLPAKVTEDDDFEDGDIATSKRDCDDEHQKL